MKKIFYAILIMFLSLPLCGYTVKGGVTYTVEMAREEAFANVEYTLPQSIIDANKVDPNYAENMRVKGTKKRKFKDRYLTFFSNGEYGIKYKNNRYYHFYYDSKGELARVGKIKEFVPPYKTFIYDTKGKLLFISYTVAYRNIYIFEANGKFDSHWIGDKGYDENGNVIGKRY